MALRPFEHHSITPNGINPQIVRVTDYGNHITIVGEDSLRHTYRIGDILELSDQNHASHARYIIKRLFWPDKATKEYVIEADYFKEGKR